MILQRLVRSVVLSGAVLATSVGAAFANAPPVRVAVVQGGGSGMEQDVVDQITQQLEGMDGVAISTVNPDWYVVCNIRENVDQMSGQIRYNGNVLVKTVGGKVVSTVAVQKYNQDFSTSPGSPLNKTLVDRAARDVINNVAARAVPEIQKAVMIEMEGRNRVDAASSLDAQGKFDEALGVIEQITPDFIEFDKVQKLHAKIVHDKQVASKPKTVAKAKAVVPVKKSQPAKNADLATKDDSAKAKKDLLLP
ncbi:MAG TPA: hypothetical protein V6C97_04155 [Oculatellaceae cyanobacterium]